MRVLGKWSHEMGVWTMFRPLFLFWGITTTYTSGICALVATILLFLSIHLSVQRFTWFTLKLVGITLLF